MKADRIRTFSRAVLFAGCFCSSITAIAATSPDVQYVKVNGTTVSNGGSITLDSFALGGTFRFKINVENNGDDSPGPYNNITISFPQFTSSSDKSRVSLYSKTGDLNYSEYFGSEAGGGDGYANFVMVESQSTDVWDGSDWLSAENESLEVAVKPKAYGDFYVYYRTAMSNQKSWTKGWTYSPSSGWYRDPLGFRAYRIKVILPAPDTTPPSNPSSFSSDPARNVWTRDNTVSISWSGASDNKGLKRYYYRWSTSSSSTVNSGDSYVNTSSGSGARTSPGLSDNSNWHFHIRYVDTSDNWATSTAHYGPFEIDRTPPATPALASPADASVHTGSTIELRWNASSDSTSGVYNYQLTYETTAWFDEKTIDVWGTKKELILAYDHWYLRVQATDKAGNQSPESVEWDFWLVVNRPPTTPGTVTAPSVTANGAVVSWGASTDPDGDTITYEIQYGKDGVIDGWNPSPPLTTTSTSIPISGLESGTTYDVRVRATDGEDPSNWKVKDKAFTTVALRIVSAYWWDPLDVQEGTVATMAAQVEGFSIGTEFSFEIREDDGFFGSDYVTTKDGTVYSSGGKYYVKAEWKTEWQEDQTGDPEFYFIVSRGSESKASRNELVVRRVLGTLHITINGIAPGDINASMLYQGDGWTEIQRKDSDLGTAPSGTSYSFSNVPYGPQYAVDVYCWDMWVGEIGPFEVSAPSVSHTIIAIPRSPLRVQLYRLDGTTPLRNTKVELFSWDGHNAEEHLRATGTTGSDGRVTFSAWPTTKASKGERYILKAYQGTTKVWEKTDVTVINDATGTTVEALVPTVHIAEVTLDRIPAKTSQTALRLAAAEEWDPMMLTGTLSHQGVHVLVTVVNETDKTFTGALGQPHIVAPDGTEYDYGLIPDASHGTLLKLESGEVQTFYFPVFYRKWLSSQPPPAGIWQVPVVLAEGTTVLSRETIETETLVLEVVEDSQSVALGPGPTFDDIVYFDNTINVGSWSLLAYNILDMVATFLGTNPMGGGLNVSYFDYINAQSEALSAILRTARVQLIDGGLHGNTRELSVSWKNVISSWSGGSAKVYYDRCIASVVIPPGVEVTDSGGGIVGESEAGKTTITWTTTRVDKLIKPDDEGEFSFSIREPADQIEIEAATNLLVGPFQGMPFTSYASITRHPMIYNYSKWNEGPEPFFGGVYWYAVGSASDQISLAGTPRGRIDVTVDGVSLGDINASILYQGDAWTETQRKDSDLGTAPSGVTYSFPDVTYGPYYIVDAYCWDMWVGETGRFSLSSPSISRTISSIPKRPLKVTAYYSDGSSPLPSATVKLFSWDGYRRHEHLRATDTTGSGGRVTFSAWPTTKAAQGERYIIQIYHGAAKVWEKTNITLANTSSGSGYTAITTVEPSTGPLIEVTPSALNFGSVFLGRSAQLQFVVKNVGGGTLSGNASGLVDPFYYVGGTSYTLEPDGTKPITVSFQPTPLGTFSDDAVFSGGGGASRPVNGSGRRLPGDANADCVVNVLDLIFVQIHLGEDPHSGDNWRYDLNEDGTIDILDLLAVRGKVRTRCD